MSQTATQVSRDNTPAIIELQKEFGTSYVLYGCKSNPQRALGAILRGWEVPEPVFAFGQAALSFSSCFTVNDVLRATESWKAEYDRKESEGATRLLADIAALDGKTAVLLTENTVAIPVADDFPVDETTPVIEFSDLPPEVQAKLEPLLNEPHVVNLGTFSQHAEFETFKLTELRKASRGKVKNGYGLIRSELETALYEAGVRKADVPKLQG